MAAVFLFVNFLALAILQPADNATNWGSFVVWLLTAIGGSWLLDRYLLQRDPLLFPLTMLLSGWGLVVIGRLEPAFAARQTLWLIVSVGALVVAIFPYILRWLRNYRYILLAVGLILLVCTIRFGVNPSDPTDIYGLPKLWLGLAGVYFQPSEVLKIILVAFLASYLGEQYPALRTTGLAADSQRWWAFSPRIVGPILLMWGMSMVILIWQRDLGTAILFFMLFLTLLYIVSGSILIPIVGVVLILAAGFVAYQLFSVVELRIDIWLNPWPEADGRAYQIVQSLQAFSAGGVFGQGIGQGSPIYIPVIHSDFVFAAIAEEWGSLGIITLLAVIAIVVMRGLRIAVLQQARPFYALLAVGLTTLIGIQSLLIMGGVLKLLPLTGVTLPFLSYGGSSLLTSFIIIGLLLRLSTEERVA